MNQNIEKIAIITSLVIHIILISLVIMVSNNDYLPNTFIVLGSHSKVETHAFYKSLPTLPASTAIQKSSHNHKKTNRQDPPKASPKKQPLPHTAAPQQKAPLSMVDSEKKVIKNPQSKPITPVHKTLAKNDNVDEDLEDIDFEDEDYDDDDLENTSPPQEKTPIKQKPNNNKYNVGGRTDLYNKELTRYQKAIQQAVSEVWTPPPAVQKGTECSLRFVINKQGNVKYFEIIKPSNVLLFDLSIKQSAAKIPFGKYEKNLCKKQIIITFRE